MPHVVRSCAGNLNGAGINLLGGPYGSYYRLYPWDIAIRRIAEEDVFCLRVRIDCAGVFKFFVIYDSDRTSSFEHIFLVYAQ